jgi:hypothetical protein
MMLKHLFLLSSILLIGGLSGCSGGPDTSRLNPGHSDTGGDLDMGHPESGTHAGSDDDTGSGIDPDGIAGISSESGGL